MNASFNSRPRLLAAAASIAALLASQSVLAEEPQSPEADAWQFAIGVGAVSHARYPGSAERKTSGFPVLSAQYGRYFIGSVPGAGVPAGLGAYLLQDDHLHVGIGLGGDVGKARQESDSPRLHGLGDVDGTVLGTVFASYGYQWFTVRSSTVSDIGGKHHGTRAALELEGKYAVSEKLSLSAGPSVTWADARYTQKFFGIDAAQSARSGRAIYTPKSGINSVGLSLGAELRVSPSWGVGAMVNASQLRGGAADSPVTERKSQSAAGLFAAYRF